MKRMEFMATRANSRCDKTAHLELCNAKNIFNCLKECLFFVFIFIEVCKVDVLNMIKAFVRSLRG